MLMLTMPLRLARAKMHLGRISRPLPMVQRMTTKVLSKRIKKKMQLVMKPTRMTRKRTNRWTGKRKAGTVTT